MPSCFITCLSFVLRNPYFWFVGNFCLVRIRRFFEFQVILVSLLSCKISDISLSNFVCKLKIFKTEIDTNVKDHAKFVLNFRMRLRFLKNLLLPFCFNPRLPSAPNNFLRLNAHGCLLHPEANGENCQK